MTGQGRTRPSVAECPKAAVVPPVVPYFPERRGIAQGWCSNNRRVSALSRLAARTR